MNDSGGKELKTLLLDPLIFWNDLQVDSLGLRLGSG
jgi:hypothetical protein